MKKSVVLLLVLFPVYAFAHGSHGSGFMAGFTHPILGIDHNIALLGTGILGYLQNQRQWYRYPLAFILLMAVGGFLGIGQEATVAIEKFIAFSVIALGLIIGLQLSFGQAVTLLILAVFGFTHGFAHGAEMPANTTALQYISGFVIGATLLAAIGWGFSLLLQQRPTPKQLFTLVGGTLIGAGLMLLL